MYRYIYIYIYVCMHARTHACMYACMCVYVCMPVCMHVCMYVCTHGHEVTMYFESRPRHRKKHVLGFKVSEFGLRLLRTG